MAGHSKWSKVKHIEGPLVVKRGAVSSKLVKEITVAARSGGGDLSGNLRLRSVVATARAANMPKDNIERAIKKGTGELAGDRCEGHGPGGIAADSQQSACLPDNTVMVTGRQAAAQVLRLHEALDDHEDTQNVYSNFEIPGETLAELPA